MRSDFRRWPTWMWSNEETAKLAEWLKEYNANLADDKKVGFYGLDMYSLWESMEEVIRYLEQAGLQDELEIAKEAFACFEPHARDAQSYGMSAAFFSEDCEAEVVKLLNEMQAARKSYDGDREASLSAELNALVAVNGEKYYRSMVRGGPESWNIRDEHMVEALNKLMAFHGPKAKAIVWEHNTHIGDARATDMAEDGMINVGQLVREQHEPSEVYAIGFSTHRGTVMAGREWGSAMEVMDVPSAMKNSWEDLMHQAGEYDQIVLFRDSHPLFEKIVGHRAIGVIYHPKHERGNYVPTVMPKRYFSSILSITRL